MAIGLDPAALGGWSNWSARGAAAGTPPPSPASLPVISPVAQGAAAGLGNTALGAAEGGGAVAKAQAEAKVAQARAAEGCQTCKERRYQDGSNDPGVSFKSPQNISPEQAGSMVMGHEMEHVVRAQAQAREEGAEVVSQSVLLHTAICPECGRSYVSGGVTRTVTAKRADETRANFSTGLEKESKGRINGKA